MNNFIKSVDVPEHLDLLKDFENECLELNKRFFLLCNI